ncbi:phage major capsid protein [Sulfitobacter sp. MOLA879]|uniref:phage major capsid protein n=1 Tax=Sulfitobacter sp. MOLA879 TaxID=3368579 RepID=UPI00374635C0
MKDVNDYRRDRKAAADTLQACAAALSALEDGGTTADAPEMIEAVAAFDAAQAAFETADKAVKRAESVEAAQAATAQSETNTPPAQTAPAVAQNPEDKGVGFAFMVHALANSGGDKDRAIARLDKDGHSGMSAALSGATDSAGGVTIPRAQAAEVIELLKPRVTVINSGARVIDMPAGEVRHARQASSATASYGPENFATPESEPTFESVDMTFKTLRTLVPVGNALLRHSGAAVMRLVRDDMLDVMGLRKDLAFLRGDGTANTPTGLKGWVLPGQTQSTVANTAAAVEAALRKMVSDVQDANVGMIAPGWIMRASTRNFLASLRDANSGAPLFPSIDQNNMLLGYPIQTTSQLPNNLGVGSDETEVFFADFNDCMVGDSMQLVISSSTEAAYVDTGGNTVSAYQNDLTLMRAIEEHDFAPRHDEAISMLTGKAWSL